jgi:hypothetical protein
MFARVPASGQKFQFIFTAFNMAFKSLKPGGIFIHARGTHSTSSY